MSIARRSLSFEYTSVSHDSGKTILLVHRLDPECAGVYRSAIFTVTIPSPLYLP